VADPDNLDGDPTRKTTAASVARDRPVEVEVETARPPTLEPNQKVRALTAVRNDGTYPGLPRGAPLIEVGDVGYIQSVGEFLLRYYIYRVDFYERGRIVGMRACELEPVEPPASDDNDGESRR
jgi:nitrogen fixation protein NifZ